jgi:AcrR family transcriptional regulator
MTAKPRPGGRSARTRAAAFDAVATLLAERGHDGFTMTEVAERAGVAATSLYRRWGDVRVLVMAAAVEQVMREHPLPDTGSLREDLSLWGRSIAASLSDRRGSSFFHAFVATAMPAGPGSTARAGAIMRRVEQIAIMLERGRARGEAAPYAAEVLDHLLAPLYMRALFGAPPDGVFADSLVNRLMKTASSEEPSPRS